jgi:starch synthase
VRILMIASEVAPFAKTGGLADVASALPRALGRLGHRVDVVMPRYRGIKPGDTVGQAAEGVRVVFVDRPEYFDREFMYGVAGRDYADNAERFAFLTRAALEWATSSSAPYEVVHAHDWQTGLTPLLLQREYKQHRALRDAGTVFTIHNLAYQGVFDAASLSRLGLGWELMHVDALEYYGRISFLKGGILFSDAITTVSPQYAREIQQPELGFGFDGILRHRSADLVGILNGIDYDQWDPARDPYLPEPYDASNLVGKRAAKRALLQEYGLSIDAAALERPLVGMISRLIDQKGFDLLASLGDELPRLNATIVLLGTGEPRYEAFWRDLAARHPARIAARIGFDEGLAHRIEGGADVFLMPSRFEPCGLNQMYSLRYGTVPVVRATGGLADTVRNFDPATGTGTGFTFGEYSPQTLVHTLRLALGVYEDRSTWRRIQVAGMQQDLSWDASARQYVKVYERVAG